MPKKDAKERIMPEGEDDAKERAMPEGDARKRVMPGRVMLGRG